MLHECLNRQVRTGSHIAMLPETSYRGPYKSSSYEDFANITIIFGISCLSTIISKIKNGNYMSLKVFKLFDERYAVFDAKLL